MINTVFYTFSTIAQTLAGAIALLGAFVLYRLQSLRSDIEKDSSDEVERAGRDENYKLHARYRHSDPRQQRQAAARKKRLNRNLSQKDSILKAFKKSLRLTVGMIFASMFALASADLIARSDILCGIVLIGGLLWFGICLYSYIVLIHKALD